MNLTEALIQTCVTQGISHDVAESALMADDRFAIKCLFDELTHVEYGHSLVDKIVLYLMKKLDSEDRLFEFADLLVQTKSNHLPQLAEMLICHGPMERVVPIVRIMLCADEHNQADQKSIARTILEAVYHYSTDALRDENLAVRIEAVRYFRDQQNDENVIDALENEASEVRSIAAWYMGQRKVYRSVDRLCIRLGQEADVEVLRGLIWSVGVLKANCAKPCLEGLQDHESEDIRSDVQHALQHLSYSP